MHKLISLTGSMLSLAVVLWLLPTNINAQTVYQHQSASSSFEMKCDGNCKFTSESSQHQTQRVGQSDWQHPSYHRQHNPNHTWHTQYNPNGHTTVTWPQRGDTCTIRYTENYSRWYKYTTSASCDDGQATIGGLVPGRTYRFQVRQDGGGWNTPQYLKAW